MCQREQCQRAFEFLRIHIAKPTFPTLVDLISDLYQAVAGQTSFLDWLDQVGLVGHFLSFYIIKCKQIILNTTYQVFDDNRNNLNDVLQTLFRDQDPI